MTDADLLRRILGAMRPDIPMDWHDQAWLAAKGLVTLEAIEADAAGVTCSAESDQQVSATPAPLDVLVAARAVVDAWEETVTATVISRTNWAIERLRYALAATPAPLTPEEREMLAAIPPYRATTPPDALREAAQAALEVLSSITMHDDDPMAANMAEDAAAALRAALAQKEADR